MKEIHIVVVEPQFALIHWGWLKYFSQRHELEGSLSNFFSCTSYAMVDGSFMRFDGLLVKENEGDVGKDQSILLPSYAVSAIFLDEEQSKLPFGFIGRDESEK